MLVDPGPDRAWRGSHAARSGRSSAGSPAAQSGGDYLARILSVSASVFANGVWRPRVPAPAQPA